MTDVSMFPPSIRDWYKEREIDLEILAAYVSGLKEHVNEEYQKFLNESVVDVYVDDERIHATVISRYRNLNTTMDLNDIFENHIEQLVIKSTLLLIYSFFENDLKKLCNLFTKLQKTNIILNDLSGKGIKKCRSFLTKVADLNFDGKINKNWETLSNYQALRNHLAHNSNLETKSKNKIKKLDGVNIFKDEINLHFIILDHFLKEIGNFYRAIDTLLEKEISK